MSKGGRRFDIHVGSLGDHTAEQGNIQRVHSRVDGLLRHFGQLLIFELRRIELQFARVLSKGVGLRFADEQQRIVDQEFGDFFATSLRCSFIGPRLTAGTDKQAFRLFGARCELDAEGRHGEAHLTFPALRANPCTGHAADHSGFRRTDIVAVKAGHREGLQDVVLDTGIGIGIDHGKYPVQAKGLSRRGTICSRPQPKVRARPTPLAKLLRN